MRKNSLMYLLILVVIYSSNAQEYKAVIKVEPILIQYQGQTVKAEKLTVSSAIPMHIDSVWNNVKTSDLLIYVTKGYTKLKPKDGAFPKFWTEGDTVFTKSRIFGFLPFGGTRSLYFETISDSERIIQTREWDKKAKVWDHKISLEQTDENTTLYTDEIVIYGGKMTGLITSFAKRFYKHRQKRWQNVATENLQFWQ